jgi:hypothetical protein
MDNGLSNTQQGSLNLIRTYDGRFAINVSSEDPGAVSRTNKIGRVVYEKYYDTVTGYLIGIEKYHSDEYGDQWNIKMLTKNGTPITVSIPYAGRITLGFFTRLVHFKTDQIMRLKIFRFEEQDGVKSAMTIEQTDESGQWYTVAPYWTKDNPNGLPDLVETVVSGKKQWDATARMNYFQRYLDERFSKRLEKDVPMIKESLNYAEQEEAPANDISTGDLPPDMPEEEVKADASSAQPPIDPTDDLPF